MSFSNTEMLWGDFLSPFNQPCLGAEESLGLLDDYLEVAKKLSSHGFSSDKAKVGASNWLAVDSLNNATDNSQEDAFSGMDWMVENMDLKEFDFDVLLGIDDLESTVSPDELMATLENTCDLLEPSIQEIPSEETTLTPEQIIESPKPPTSSDQTASLSPLLTLALSPEPHVTTADNPFSLELGSEIDVLEGDGKTEAHIIVVIPLNVIPKCEKEEEAHSDNDSGICMSPDSYFCSPQQSPTTSVSSLSDEKSVAAVHIVSVRPTPYDHPEEKVALKMKGEKRVDKKLKKMEQNKTAATRYRQKKRLEQKALSGECRELEQKNEVLREKADSLSKEIQYLKDLIEEVRKAKNKKVKVPE
uniref:Cyclic AMP-dependent transcription factor ATF-4 n=1 Tax=Anolis carolinensis TaxID=28377 RepID=G1KGS8_ANOCA|nr:PREDICTED: cyclic AMP-dependent transcription factor ATF-4 [Anolis carolinensis]|eukprot:XP_003221029.1 PREDICTED: cyclic AMP-dependent transcription factor ATF-4 [Anolis carolinensis]